MGRATSGKFVALLAFSLLLAVACGGGGGPPSSPTATAPRASPAPSPSPTPGGPALEPPGRDLIDLARRFRGLPADSPRLARDTPPSLSVGDSQEFAVIDLDTPAVGSLSASLRYVSDHAYLYVEDGIAVSQGTLAAIASDFDQEVHPTVTAAFGREWSPGVDSDPRITLLHANLRGAGGYFSGSDEYPLSASSRSNEREMLYLEAGALAPGTAYNALVAHELQHMIHWNADQNEDAWVNEGLSQVAAEEVATATGGIQAFLVSPDTQLTFWPAGPEDTSAHYAASQLFFRYLLDRFGGRERAADLLAVPEDGTLGVDAYLKRFDTTFEDVFADWVIANYLDEPSGPYSHAGADLRVAIATTIGRLGTGDGTVNQFAADYLEIDPPTGGAVFTFEGSLEAGVGPPARDGGFWWSNRGDGIDSRLTREFDLTGLAAATLRFWTWFETERGWDYAYVAASTDGGRTWRALPGAQTTDYDPIGLAYGPGYTDASGGGPAWVQEQIDLTPFAGQKVLLRFEYVTDDSSNLGGLAVDDIDVPELGYLDPATSDGGWQTEGFQRIEGPLKQRFVLQRIVRGEPNRVERIEVDAGNRARVPLNGPATIVVAAISDGPIVPASYRWSLEAP